MLDLLDYRRRVSDLYAHIRANGTNEETHAIWRSVRDDLFAHHPQSALDDEQKMHFRGLNYFGYDPRFRVLAQLEPLEATELQIELGDDGVVRLKRIGRVSVNLPTGTGGLGVFWVMGYGGGIFIPFGDATNKDTTYGAGRYLYDTIKGADLGNVYGNLVLDFNFAYNPSCAYNYRWVCPLAQPESKLAFPIPVGEKIWA